MSLQQNLCYEFDSFRLNSRGLSHNGEEIDLPPKALGLLITFVKKANDLISKEELMKSVWSDTFVEEANLTNNISQLRKVLQDRGGKEYIKTYPRRGYTFEALVSHCIDASQIHADTDIQKHGLFSEFHLFFPSAIQNANEITLFFIHSRRWRENHRDALKKFLQREKSKLSVFLPEIENKNMVSLFKEHFEDGPHIESFVLDAYQDFARLSFEYKNKVSIRAFDLYPVYSFYKFDGTVILALYPNTNSKKDVPTFQFNEQSKYWAFVMDDIQRLTKKQPISKKKLRWIIAQSS